MKAFIDESGSEKGDRRLFLAGYLNHAQSWSLFAEAWAEELRAAPAIEYMHMVEAGNFRGQFARKNGWDEKKRSEKLRGLARVIRHFDPISFQISIDRSHFHKVLAPVSPRGLANPYFVLCNFLVAKLAQQAEETGNKGTIEFIFDSQDGAADDVEMFFDDMMKGISTQARRRVAGKLAFKSDREFVGLQAADMLAWHIRREHEDIGFPNMPMAEFLRANSHLVLEIPNEMIDLWAKHHQQQRGIDLVKSKSQWRNFKKENRKLRALGVNPSRVTRAGIYYPDSWGFFGRAIEYVRRLLGR